MLNRLRYPLLATAIATLLVATWAGLRRMGWALPTPNSLVAGHGPLMVSGFLGTLIGLERAVALADLGGWLDVRRWAGMLNAVALLLFLALIVLSLRRRTAAP